MNISHLTHSADGIIRCTCGYEFEVRRSELADPQRLVERKESIAAKHVCQNAKHLQPPKMKHVVDMERGVWQHPVGEAQLSHYFTQAVRRQMSA